MESTAWSLSDILIWLQTDVMIYMYYGSKKSLETHLSLYCPYTGFCCDLVRVLVNELCPILTEVAQTYSTKADCRLVQSG